MRLSHLALAMALISAIGFSDASFLTMEHYRGAVPPCVLVNGCAIVTSSSYSVILGVPAALLGTFYYLIILVGAIGYLDTRRVKLLRSTAVFTIFGFLFSLWFLYVQAFILRAFCSWCLLSAATSILLFIVGIFIWRHRSTAREKIDAVLNR